MNDAVQVAGGHSREDRSLRRADRRRRHLRRRRRLPPDAAVPRHQLRRAGGAGELRRHLDDAPLSRHPLGQRPVHLRLSLQALDRRADRHGRRDPDLHGRGDRRERPRPAHPLPAPDLPAQAGRARTTSGRSRPPAPTPARPVRFTANFLWMCQGYYRHSEGYTPEWEGMADFKGQHRPPADLAGGPRLPRQEGGRHRLGRHGGDADPGDGARRAPTSRCCSARRPISGPAATRSRSPTSCASCRSTRHWIHEIVRRKILLRAGGVHATAAFDEPEAVKQELLAGVRAYLGPDYDIDDALHAALPALAAAPRLRPGRRPVPGRSPRARPRSSPTRSSASPRPASC